MKKIKAVIEKGESGIYSVYAPDLKEHAINGQGKTIDEAKEDFGISFDEVVAIYTDEGLEIPNELKTSEFEYVYDIASVFDYLKCINVSVFAERAGINASLLRQYRNKITFASETQKRKIETALHGFGEELTAISL